MPWNIPRNGPVSIDIRNPRVGEPPLIQARSAPVEYPRPKVLSRNAHRNTDPRAMRNTARVRAAAVVLRMALCSPEERWPAIVISSASSACLFRL